MEGMKQEFIARVRNGRLVLDEATDLPEGTVVDLAVADPAAVDRARLDAALLESEADGAAGRIREGRDVIADLRKNR